MEVARGVSPAGGRDYLDVTRSGFLVRGGASSQSVSVVNLIKAGRKRGSSREQVPLTAESGSAPGLLLLPALCLHGKPTPTPTPPTSWMVFFSPS